MEIDEQSGNEFYFNDDTGESSWERPMRKPSGNNGRKKRGSGGNAGSKMEMDRSEMTEKQIQALDWEISKDGAGNPIYINIKTGEMEMEKPECLVSSEDENEEDEGEVISEEEQGLRAMTEDDWELVRENSEVTFVWGDWETYIHLGKPEKYDAVQKKEYEKRIKEMEKKREEMLEVRAKRLKDTEKRREEEDKKMAKMTLRMKRELAKKREKENQEEEKIQQEEEPKKDVYSRGEFRRPVCNCPWSRRLGLWPLTALLCFMAVSCVQPVSRCVVGKCCECCLIINHVRLLSGRIFLSFQ